MTSFVAYCASILGGVVPIGLTGPSRKTGEASGFGLLNSSAENAEKLNMDDKTENGMKLLFVVNYWLPFPQSEYGGTFVVIAKGKDECLDLLKEFRSEANSRFDEEMKYEVENALPFPVSGTEKSRIVYTFTT